MQTQTEYAFIKHIEEDIGGVVVNVFLESVDWYDERPVSILCFFRNDWMQKLSTLNNQKSIEFGGKVGNYSSGIVFLTECNLK